MIKRLDVPVVSFTCNRGIEDENQALQEPTRGSLQLQAQACDNRRTQSWASSQTMVFTNQLSTKLEKLAKPPKKHWFLPVP